MVKLVHQVRVCRKLHKTKKGIHLRNKNSESQKFITLETISARILLCATILALCLSNTPLHIYYENFFHTYSFWQFGSLHFKTNLLFLINDGLMTIFFLVVGLEIKYEILNGNLNTLRKATLPGIAAVGGMMVPALIYAGLNYHNPAMLRGWGVPTATDIAFSLSVVSLLGNKVPPALKTFLIALAILDDIAAIIIIALFYTDHFSLVFFSASFICLAILFLLNRFGITKLSAYIFIGFALWICLLKSGIHPTLTGVMMAMMIPLQNQKTSQSPLKKLKHTLHPWVALVILPLFAFANAGISLITMHKENLHITIIFGVLFGLFFGKQMGIFGASFLAVKLKLASLPDHIKWSELYAIAIICGIGFTISLFIGTLAFTTESYLNSIKLGVLGGSFLSGCAGFYLLSRSHPSRKK